MKSEQKLLAKKLLATLKDLQRSHAKDHYDIGRILVTLFEGKMYSAFGRESWREFVHKDSGLSRSMVNNYMALYRHLKRLGYTEKEAVANIEAIGWNALSKILPSASAKLSVRTAKKRYDELYEDIEHIVMTLTPAEAKRAERVLLELGLEKAKSGRRNNVSEVFMGMVDAYEEELGLKRKAG